MSRDPIERVEIIDPPISELTKRHHGFARTCITGCLFIVIFIAGVVVGVRWWLGGGPQELAAVPAEFPQDIPLYDKDSIEHISFISAKYKNRSLKLAALSPKLFLAPLLEESTDSLAASGLNTAQGFWQILTAPATDLHNVVRIEWRAMPADPDFVVSHYRTQLRKKGYTAGALQTSTDELGTEHYNFSFTGKQDVRGSLAITDNADSKGTDYALLTVHTAPITAK